MASGKPGAVQTDEFNHLSQPSPREIQAALLYDYRTNVAFFPRWQAWLREHRPPTLIACPLDHVNHQFHAPAPNRLWVSDFTYVTWSGFAYVAFVIDAYARRIEPDLLFKTAAKQSDIVSHLSKEIFS